MEFRTDPLTFFVWGGYFGSLWSNVPLAPVFNYPVRCPDDPELASWNVDRRTNVFFGGPAVKLGVRF